MNKINTTAKGDAFEEIVFNFMSELLDNDELYACGKKSKIYRKKSYYSEERKDKIIFDITIETCLNNSEQYSLLTVIECKNYAHEGVPVSDIEEFDSKLTQIGKHNAKGIVVTNSSYQKSALTIAKSQGIALIRINDNKPEWINYRIDKKCYPSVNTIEEELVSSEIISNFSALQNDKSFIDLQSIFIEIGIIDKYCNKPKYINFPFLTEQEIENRIKNLSLNNFYKDEKLQIELICDHLKKVYNVFFKFEDDLGCFRSNMVLGKITFNPVEISITKELKNNNHRWRFTLAHEIGHLILHYEKLREYFDENVDNEMTIDAFGKNFYYSFNNLSLGV
jgi:hypothetical protein